MGGLHVGFMDVAPAPGLARLVRPYDRMLDRQGVPPRVAQRRRVAAADVPARQAQSQVDPRRTELQALLASLRRVRRDLLADERKAGVGHRNASSIQPRSALAGAAPARRATTWPSFTTISVGTACTAKRSDSLGASSTLTFTSFTLPASSVATC